MSWSMTTFGSEVMEWIEWGLVLKLLVKPISETQIFILNIVWDIDIVFSSKIIVKGLKCDFVYKKTFMQIQVFYFLWYFAPIINSCLHFFLSQNWVNWPFWENMQNFYFCHCLHKIYDLKQILFPGLLGKKKDTLICCKYFLSFFP